ncbi:MAG: thiolase family protein [Proteobacteria bacterium]|nr:thiolase family protein [Pseudomonadota bacterium]MBU4468863.1 thiolase family protein [Pseudomonadota bacterium]MCG2750856.1 thiolase family protein [Desulfobacteraceae bacterium]
MRKVMIAGVGLTRFDRYDGEKGRPEKEFFDLGSEAILAALKDADMEWSDIQAAFCGSVYCGTGAGHQVIERVGLTGIPIVNVENACSSGISALRLAFQMVGAGIYDIMIAVGFETMPRGPIKSTSWPLWERYMGFNLQPAQYAMKTVRFMEDTGATEEDFARVSVKNRKNATLNPNARMQKEVTVEEVMASRMVAKPLRLLHACPLADGGSAMILCSEDKLKKKGKAVEVAAASLTSGFYSSPKVKGADHITESANQAFAQAGIGPEDIDVVQAYDTMSPAELWDLELLGFCKKGDAPRRLREGHFNLDGSLPVNTDGGLMGRGHPLGATALAQCIELYRQIRGEAGPRQIKNGKAKTGLAHAMGAGPNSGVVILKR